MTWSTSPNGATGNPPPGPGENGYIQFSDAASRTVTYVNPGFTNSIGYFYIGNTGGGYSALNQAQDYFGAAGLVVGNGGQGVYTLSGGTAALGAYGIYAQNIGVVSILGGTLNTASLRAGLSGGTFLQSGGVVNADQVLIATSGSYSLSGTGQLNAGTGNSSLSGTYIQRGGDAVLPNTILSGTMTISGGTLAFGAIGQATGLNYTQSGGSVTVGTNAGAFVGGNFTITDGSLTFATNTLGLSLVGMTYRQGGGTVVTPSLSISGSNATFYMTAGTINAASGTGIALVGIDATQAGTIVTSALLSRGSSSNTYAINNATLTATGAAGVVFDGVNVVQNGGTITTPTFFAHGSNNTYVMNGGSIIAGAGTNVIGTPFTQSGGSISVSGSLGVSSGSSLQTPTYALKDGATLNVGGNLYSGTIFSVSNPVGNSDTGYQSGAGSIVQMPGSQVHAQNVYVGPFAGRGSYELDSGATLTVDNTFTNTGTYDQEGGTLTANAFYAIGTNTINGGSVSISGSFTAHLTVQNSGTVHAQTLQIGNGQLGSPSFNQFTLSGGSLLVDSGLVSHSGTFTQSGGDATINGDFVMKNASTTSISGGTLTIAGAIVSQADRSDVTTFPNVATFTQSGGDVRATSFSLGTFDPLVSFAFSGAYIKTGGSLTVTNGVNYVGFSNVASFSQSAGSFDSGPLVVGNNLRVVYDGRCAFTLTGGTVNVRGNFNVGPAVGSDYLQTGGSAAISGSMSVGHGAFTLPFFSETTSSASISAGQLSVAGGITNYGAFLYSGGALDTPIVNNVMWSNKSYLQPTFAFSGTGTRSLNSFFNTGNVVAQSTTVQFTGAFTNNASYVSGNADNHFATLINGPAAFLQGDATARFRIAADFLSSSTNAASWSTDASTLEFGGGTSSAHLLGVTGADVGGQTLTGFDHNFGWGALQLDAGQFLTLQDGNGDVGGALYVDAVELTDGLAQINSITGNGLNIYYNATDPANAYLGGQTYPLVNGGFLIGATPEPAALALGVLFAAGWTRRRGRRPGQSHSSPSPLYSEERVSLS